MPSVTIDTAFYGAAVLALVAFASLLMTGRGVCARAGGHTRRLAADRRLIDFASHRP